MPPSNLAFTLELKNIVRLSWELLTKRERIEVAGLAVAMMINGILQTFSLALLIPFIGLMLDPSALKSHARLAALDRFLGSPPPETLLAGCAVALLVAVISKDVFEYFVTHYQSRLVARVERRVSGDLLTQCMAAPYEWFLSNSTARLQSAVMTHVVVWARAGLKGALAMTSNGVLILSFVIFLAAVDPVFGIALTLIGAVLGFAILALVKRRMRRVSAVKHEAHDEAFKYLSLALSGFKDIKINGRETYFVRQYADAQRVYADSEASLVSLQNLPKYAIEIAIALILVAIGLVAARSQMRAEMATTLAVYGVAVVRMVPIFNQVSGTVAQFHMAVPAIWNVRRTHLELAELAARQAAVSDSPVIATWDNIKVEDIQYAYPRAPLSAIDGISFVIQRGMRLGVVGRSGSGKTTLVDILTGLLPPNHGRVVIGGQELTLGNGSSWRRQIGYVPQAPFIAEGTLGFNVSLETDPGKMDERKVLEALHVANLGDLLQHEMQSGLSSELGDKGNRLSGGQRQRVAIARALYRDPSFLIFDEATSSLDAESENEISLALGRISRDKTVLIIAHRLSTVKDCDRILVLEKGAVIGFDSHDNLIRTCPTYRRFVELGDLSPGAPNEDENFAAMVAAK
jgi:ABC-type multidrug transport system fused ATPase/permease subunit